MNTVAVSTEFIKLDSAMKLAGAVVMGSEAKHEIQGGAVEVNGETETRRGRKLYVGDRFSYGGQEYEIVKG